jgi:hypothetical protein
METTFQFIDNGSIDERTRKLIRSHAMKGKNLGRKITRRTRNDVGRQAASSIAEATDIAHDQSDSLLATQMQALVGGNGDPRPAVIAIRQLVTYQLFPATFPVELTPSVMSLVHKCELKHDILI